MSPLVVFSMPDIPVDGTPLLGHSFAGLTIPPKGKWDHSPSDSPDHLHIKRTCITSPEVEFRMNIAPHGAMTIHLTQHQRPGPTLDNNDKSPPVPSEGQLTPMMMWWQAAPRALETKCPQTLAHPEEAWWTLTWTLLLEIASPAQTLMRYLWGWFIRSIEKESGHPAS